jgi:AcrR family transcriptional regulator
MPSPSASVPAAAPGIPGVDLTRQRLIRAALELFLARGYHDTTTAQIAKKAGVAEGTIYRHFASKQQLLNELYRAAQRWATRLTNEAAAADAKNTRARLALVAQGLVDGAARDPAVVKLGLLGGDRYEPLLDDESRKANRELRTALERIVAEGKSEGSVRAGAVDIWAAVWLAAIGLAIDRVMRGDWKPGDSAVRLVIEGAWAAIAS